MTNDSRMLKYKKDIEEFGSSISYIRKYLGKGAPFDDLYKEVQGIVFELEEFLKLYFDCKDKNKKVEIAISIEEQFRNVYLISRILERMFIGIKEIDDLGERLKIMDIDIDKLITSPISKQ